MALLLVSVAVFCKFAVAGSTDRPGRVYVELYSSPNRDGRYYRPRHSMRSLLTHPYILVFVGGGAGSLLRYTTGKLMPTTFLSMSFPTATLAVNIIASFILGTVMGWVLSRVTGEDMRLLIGVGFCGGLSTFSSFSNDTLALLQSNRPGAALFNIGLNVILCLLASAGGLWLGQKTT